MSEGREPPAEVRLAPPKTIVLWMDGKKYHT
jgi:tRNA(His) 5'-end guanylyltransferase